MKLKIDAANSMKHYNIQVIGKVQGVFFRKSAREVARKLALKGFVKNEEDGSVIIAVEGNEEKLEDFLTWCATGPEAARVTSVNCEEGDWEGFEAFNIHHA